VSDEERYQPLPSIVKLPGFLIGKLSSRGRRRFWIGAVVAAVALAALAAVMVPRIAGNKRDQARQDRADAARALVERRRALEREQLPRSGRADASGAAALEASLQRAIVADVALRSREGTVHNAAIRAECKRLGTIGSRIAFSCTAVTSDIPGGEVSRGGVVGYPYRALGDPRSRRFSFCKVSGRPGEGSNTGRALVELPAACGG
jgi:hypothetical protein